MSHRLRAVFPILLLLAAAPFSLGACAADQARTSAESAQRVDAPTSAKELLANLRAGMQQGVLLSSVFYTEDTLKRFFGATQIKWRRNTDTSLSVQLRGLDYLPVRKESPARIGISRSRVDASGKLDAAGKLIAAFSLSCTCELRVADIEAVFGPSGVVTDERERLKSIQGHMSLPPPARDPMGHKRLSYDIATDAAYESTLSVVFDQDGRVETIEARQREA